MSKKYEYTRRIMITTLKSCVKFANNGMADIGYLKFSKSYYFDVEITK